MSSESDQPETGLPAHDEPLVTPTGEPSGVPAGTGDAPGSEGTEAGTALTEPGDAVGSADPVAPAGRPNSHNMLPPRDRRRSGAERFLVRLIATGGIVGIGVAIAAIMVSSNSQGWLVGLVVSIVSVVLAAVLWSSRQL
ncbi:MAG: hypothetical protein WBQ18_03645 [Solirubrobacteraceae bacterium]